MGEFEEYIKGKYPTDYEHLKCKYPNVPVVEFYGDEQDVWNHQQSKIEQLNKITITQGQRINGKHQELCDANYKIEQLEKEKAEITRLVQGLRNEFDLWSDDGEGFDAIEAQIELLEESSRGDSCE